MKDQSTHITISAAIIVKDEERCISRCLHSIFNLFDEIVIVDTGSTDSTIKLIHEFNSDKVRLFHVSWDDDFSKPRNLAIDKCTSKFVFFIDADEYLSTTRELILDGFTRINNSKSLECNVYSPIIKDHDGNISRTVQRAFLNNGFFYYYGYVHEEVRRKDNGIVENTFIDIMIHHDGYKSDILISKEKINRNNSLNLKNIHQEPDNLRWKYFYHRDNFEGLEPSYIYNTLLKSLKLKINEPLSQNNLKIEKYTFAILDLMARARLKSLDNDDEFKIVIALMNKLLPGNSNSFYYELIYEILQWKVKARKKINDIIAFKQNGSNFHDGMIHSEGLHIDSVLSFYLYEAGLIEPAAKLLRSVKKNGFNSEMVKSYLNNINQQNSEGYYEC